LFFYCFSYKKIENRPVIDWYYGEKRMLELLIEFKDEMSDEEKQRFSDDFPNLKPIRVKDLLDEMVKKSTLFDTED
jgi:hypothetical protein